MKRIRQRLLSLVLAASIACSWCVPVSAVETHDHDAHDHPLAAEHAEVCEVADVHVTKDATVTCTKDGLSAEITCLGCGEILQEQIKAKKTGHNYQWTNSEFAHWQECQNCGAIKSEAVHKYGTKDCAEAGVCSTCGYEKAAGEHIWGKAKVTVKVTCVEDGEKTYTCTTKGCGATECEVVEAHGEPEVDIEGYPATCTSDGMTDKLICSECGKVVQKQTKIKKHHTWTAEEVDEISHALTCSACGEDGGEEDHEYDVACDEPGACVLCGHEKESSPHQVAKWKTTKKVTCIEPGERTGTCKLCGETVVESIEPHGTPVVEEGIPATCTEDGVSDKITCSDCGKIVQKAATLKALGHDFVTPVDGVNGHAYQCSRCDALSEEEAHEYTVEDCDLPDTCTVCGHEKAAGEHLWVAGKVTKKATCAVEGAQSYKCDLCGDTKSVPIPTLPHTPKVLKAKAATCDKAGLTEGSQCSKCKTILVEQKVIPAQGHDEEITKEGYPATCTENGKSDQIVCKICKKTIQKQTSIPKLGHDFTEVKSDEFDHWYICTREDCGMESEYEAHDFGDVACDAAAACVICGYERAEGGEHNWGKEKVTKKATCTAEGEKIVTCDDCGFVETQIIEKLPHTIKVLKGKAATCLKDGLTEGQQCSKCKEILVPQEVIPAPGHDEVITAGYDATCTADGLTDKIVCATCNKTIQKASKIKKLGHDFSVADWNEEEHWYGCSRCDEVDDAEAHDYGDAYCHEVGVTCTAEGCEHIRLEVGEHEWGKAKVTKKATCTEEGEQQFTCELCDFQQTEIIEKLPHTETVLKGKAATCEEPGLTEGKQCSKCKEITVVQEVIPALGHDVEILAAEKPTCTEDGLTEGELCLRCDKTLVKQEVIDALGHDFSVLDQDEVDHWYNCSRDDCDEHSKYESHDFGDASCEEEGECVVCKHPKAAGDHIWDNGKTITEPGCLTDGLIRYTCEECGKQSDMIIEALGHAPKTVAGKEATCEKDGLTVGEICSRCGETLIAQVVIEALGHDEVVDIEGYPATCEEAGKTDKIVCDRCGVTIQKQTTIKKLGHNYQWMWDEYDHWQECVREDCGEMKGKYEEHEYSSDTDATCDICGAEREVNDDLYAVTNFYFKEDSIYWAYPEVDGADELTYALYYSQDGGAWERYAMYVGMADAKMPRHAGAGEYIFRVDTIKAGEVLASVESDLLLTVYEEKGSMKTPDISVYEELRSGYVGYEISGLAPNSVYSIDFFSAEEGYYAADMNLYTFDGATSKAGEFESRYAAEELGYFQIRAALNFELSEDGREMSFTLAETEGMQELNAIIASGVCGLDAYWTLNADGVLTVGGKGTMFDAYGYDERWYDYREVITAVVIKEGVTTIGTHNFRECPNLTSVTLPQTLTSIRMSAFELSTSLKHIELPDSITVLGQSVFYGSGLESVRIPAGVTAINAALFRSCENLKTVEIHDKVTRIDMYAFQYCESLTDVVLPAGLTYLGQAAFSSCDSLTDIVIPDGVTVIPGSAFSGCGELKEMTIPVSVTRMESGALSYCDSLTDIWYGGSESQWNAIDIQSQSGFDWEKCTIHYGADSIASGTCGDLNWKLSANGVLTISGEGDMYFDGDEAPWNGYINAIREIVIEDGAKSIAEYAFYGCSGLKTVTMTNSVTWIGDYAFYGCDDLTDVYFDGSEDDWREINIGARNQDLTYANIHCSQQPVVEDKYAIGDFRFSEDNLGLLQFTNPAAALSEDLRFSMYWSKDGGEWECYVMSGHFDTRRGFTEEMAIQFRERGTYTFRFDVVNRADYNGQTYDRILYTAYPNLVVEVLDAKDVNIPEVIITKAEEGYFEYEASNLTPKAYTFLDFYNADEFFCGTTLWMPAGETSLTSNFNETIEDVNNVYVDSQIVSELNRVDDTLLYYAVGQSGMVKAGVAGEDDGLIDSGTCGENLTWTLDVNGLLTISGTGEMTELSGNWDPAQKQKVTKLVIEEGATSICSRAFDFFSNLTEAIIPGSVRSIGEAAFYECRQLSKVTLSEGLLEIGPGAFQNCRSLTDINLPSTLTSIGSYAFQDCRSLTDINLPGALISIDRWAFKGCSILTDVYYDGTRTEWNEVDVDQDNEELFNATIHFSKEPVVDNEYAVTNVRYEWNKNGFVYLTWDAPDAALENMKFKVTTQREPGVWGSTNTTTGTSMKMDQEDETWEGPYWIYTMNGTEEVAVVETDLVLEIDYVVSENNPPAYAYLEDGSYKFLVSGFEPGAMVVTEYGDRNADSWVVSSQIANAKGQILVDGVEVYDGLKLEDCYCRIYVLTDYILSEDGKTMSYTSTYRGYATITGDDVTEPDPTPDGDYYIDVFMEGSQLIATIVAPEDADRDTMYTYFFYNSSNPNEIESFGRMPAGARQPFNFRPGYYDSYKVLLWEEDEWGEEVVLGEGKLAKPIRSVSGSFDLSGIELIVGELNESNGKYACTLKGLELDRYFYTMDGQRVRYFIYSEAVNVAADVLKNETLTVEATRTTEMAGEFLQECSNPYEVPVIWGETPGDMSLSVPTDITVTVNSWCGAGIRMEPVPEEEWPLIEELGLIYTVDGEYDFYNRGFSPNVTDVEYMTFYDMLTAGRHDVTVEFVTLPTSEAAELGYTAGKTEFANTIDVTDEATDYDVSGIKAVAQPNENFGETVTISGLKNYQIYQLRFTDKYDEHRRFVMQANNKGEITWNIKDWGDYEVALWELDFSVSGYDVVYLTRSYYGMFDIEREGEEPEENFNLELDLVDEYGTMEYVLQLPESAAADEYEVTLYSSASPDKTIGFGVDAETMSGSIDPDAGDAGIYDMVRVIVNGDPDAILVGEWKLDKVLEVNVGVEAAPALTMVVDYERIDTEGPEGYIWYSINGTRAGKIYVAEDYEESVSYLMGDGYSGSLSIGRRETRPMGEELSFYTVHTEEDEDGIYLNYSWPCVLEVPEYIKVEEIPVAVPTDLYLSNNDQYGLQLNLTPPSAEDLALIYTMDAEYALNPTFTYLRSLSPAVGATIFLPTYRDFGRGMNAVVLTLITEPTTAAAAEGYVANSTQFAVNIEVEDQIGKRALVASVYDDNVTDDYESIVISGLNPGQVYEVLLSGDSVSEIHCADEKGEIALDVKYNPQEECHSGVQIWEITVSDVTDTSAKIVRTDYGTRSIERSYAGIFENGIRWSLVDGVLTISGEGYMEWDGTTTPPWHDYRGEICEVVIEPGIKSVYSYAFHECENVTSVVLPEGIEYIGISAFASNHNLYEVTIPVSVTKIDRGAFSHCSGLEHIYYGGTEDDWNRMTIFDGYLFVYHFPTVHYMGIEPVFPNVFFSDDGAIRVDASDLPEGYWGTFEVFYENGEERESIMDGEVWGCDGHWIYPDMFTFLEAGNYHLTVELRDANGEVVSTEPLILTAAEDIAEEQARLTFAENSYTISGLMKNAQNLWTIRTEDDVKIISADIWMYGSQNQYTEEYESIHNYEKLTLNAHAIQDYTVSDDGKVLFYTVTTLADDTDFDVFNWEVNGDTLTIRGNGPMPDWTWDWYYGIGWREYRGQIKKIIIEDGITTIGDNAFSEFWNLTSVSIPGSVTVIKQGAFSECENLTSVVIPEGVTDIENYAFGNCSNLTSISLPDTLTGISDQVFYNCDSLLTVDIPESVGVIGSNAFYDCDGLQKIVIPSGVVGIWHQVFYSCDNLMSVTLPEGLVSIGSSAFDDCTSLTKVNLPEGLVSIDKRAFAGTDSLSNVTIPDSVTSIGAEAFSGSGLTKVTIPAGIVEIKESTFQFCDNLTTVTIPEGIVRIGYNAFYRCENLSSVTLPESLTKIGTSAFYCCRNLKSVTIPANVLMIEGDAFRECESLVSLTIPEGVMTIGDSAFQDCSALRSVVLPDSVMTLGNWAFAGCTSMTSVILPKDLASIGESVFRGSGLRSVVLPDGLTSIGAQAFSYCEALTSVTIPDSLVTIGEQAFMESGLTSIEIPESVSKISNNAFDCCYYLKSVKLHEGLSVIGEHAFANCDSLRYITIPASVSKLSWGAFRSAGLYGVTILGVTNIDQSAFEDCDKLLFVILPDALSHIGERAFAGCQCLMDVYYAGSEDDWNDYVTVEEYSNEYLLYANFHYGYDGTEEIPEYDAAGTFGEGFKWTLMDGMLTIFGEGAMEDWDTWWLPAWYDYREQITQVTIQKGVTHIGAFAFYDCVNLTEVTIPDSVTSIGSSAFERCSSLAYIELSDGLTELGEAVFRACSVLKSIVIPEGVTKLNWGMFYECTNLSEVTLPDSLVDLGESAFEDCTSLKKFVIPEGVDHICSYAFYGCTNLAEITIPANVTNIYYMAFDGCDSLTDIYYGGSKTQWEEIYLDEQGSCNLNSCNIHYAGGGEEPDDATTTSGTCGKDLKWVLKEGVLTISGTGDMSSWNSDSDVPWCDFTEDITCVIVKDGVTSIGDWAFAYCWNLEELELADSITSIGDCAFVECGYLEDTVELPANLTKLGASAFESSGLRRIEIPVGVEKIMNDTFSGCSYLEEVVLGENVTVIGNYAFDGCSSLSTITLPDSVDYIAPWAFASSGLTYITIPEGIDTIWHNTFEYCESLNEVNLPDSLRTIGEGAFVNCYALETIDLPEELNHIAPRAFEGSGLTCITVPGGMEWVPNEAFTGCENLREVVLEEPITEIGNSAFEGCWSLEYVEMPQSLRRIGNSAFCDTGLTSIVIPGEVTEIGEWAFAECTELSEVILPDCLERIGEHVFEGCTSLTFIEFPWEMKEIGYMAFAWSGLEEVVTRGALERIGESAFEGCESLRRVEIGEGYDGVCIENYAFAGCSSLEELWLAITVTVIGDEAFGDCHSLETVNYQGTEEDWNRRVYLGELNFDPSIITFLVEDY